MSTDDQPAPAPQRLMGLDVGHKRIGVAVSDALGLTAQPLLTLVRGNPRDDLRSLRRLLRRYGCTAVVVGNPLHMSGEASPQGARTRHFAQLLGEMAGVPIHLWDERLTTLEAHAILYEAGRPRVAHKAVVDQVAAVLILESYLQAHRESPGDQRV